MTACDTRRRAPNYSAIPIQSGPSDLAAAGDRRILNRECEVPQKSECSWVCVFGVLQAMLRVGYKVRPLRAPETLP